MTAFVAAAGALGILLIFDGATRIRSTHRSSVVRAWSRLVREAGVGPAGARWYAWGSVGALVLGFIAVTGTTGAPVLGLAFALAAGIAPVSMLKRRRERRRRSFGEAWPDAISALISSVRSGVSLGEACCSLADRGPAELRPGWAAFASTYHSTGSFEAAIETLRAQLADPIADRVVAALLVAREVGGTDLVRVLRALSDFVREDLRIRKEIEARWSWTVTAARVAAAAPWAVLLLMSTRPESAAAYNTSTGAAVIAGGAAATFVGYKLMLRVGRLPDQRRLG